jgi:hypothetical protein
MGSQSKRKQETALVEIIIISAVIIAGFALQFVIGPLDFGILVFPVNLILGFILLLPILFKLSQPIRKFGSGKVSVILLIIVTIMAIYMGLVSGNDVKHSWPFAFVYLMCMVNLAIAIGKRVRKFRLKKDYGFMLNHIGLLLLLFAAGPGSADMQRWFMTVAEGATEWRGERSGATDPVELPIAITLLDFKMDEYPPKIAIVDKVTGESQPVKRPVFVEAVGGETGIISGWRVSVDSFDYRPMMAPVAMISAERVSDGKILTGRVSCGNHFQQFRILDIDERLCFAMTYPEPERFSSQVEVFTKDGKEKSGVVEVNAPIKTGSWNIYQYSYDTSKGRDSQISIFELVYDPWLIPAYAGIAMVMLGSLTLLFRGGKRE